MLGEDCKRRPWLQGNKEDIIFRMSIYHTDYRSPALAFMPMFTEDLSLTMLMLSSRESSKRSQMNWHQKASKKTGKNVIDLFFSWTEIERQRDEVACRAAAEVVDQGHSLPHHAALGGETQAASSHGPVQQLQGQLCQELRL